LRGGSRLALQRGFFFRLPFHQYRQGCDVTNRELAVVDSREEDEQFPARLVDLVDGDFLRRTGCQRFRLAA
jgi:hypothetical protein